MSGDDVRVAGEFLDVLAHAASGGDRARLYSLLSSDVEWLTPLRDLHGVDADRDELSWIRPPDHLDVEFDRGELNDLGGGRVLSEVRETYRVKRTGEFAYKRARLVDVTIRDGKVSRYEMRLG